LTASSNRTLEADPTPWIGLFPIDTATPITTAHLVIEYLDEVVRSARWSGGLGRAPGGAASEPCFNDVGHHLSALFPEITSSSVDMARDTLDNDLVTFINQVLD